MCSCDVDIQPSDGCCLRPPCAVRDGFDDLVELVIVDCFEVAAVCGSEDWIGDCGANELADTCCNSLLRSNCRQKIRILAVCFQLGLPRHAVSDVFLK